LGLTIFNQFKTANGRKPSLIPFGDRLQMGFLLFILLVPLSFLLNAAQAEVVRNDQSDDMKELNLPLYEWQNDLSHAKNVNQPIVVVIHGAAQQAGSVDVMARRLALCGYLVVAPDLRGDGRWRTIFAGRETSGGAFGDFTRSCQDLQTLLNLLRRKHPHSEIFCMGESAGATVVLSAVSHSGKNIKGVILLAAGCEPHLHSPGSMGPGFYGKLLNVAQPVDMTNYITRYSSDDERVGQEMVTDPLSKNSLSALELLGTLNFINKAPEFASQMPKAVSVLVMQGKLDQIVEPSSANKVFSALKTTDKTYLLLPESGHILIGTAYLKDSVFEPIQRWLSAHSVFRRIH
jgi:alpha-beta hydrolase superfamily lysophospholipase